MALQVPTHSDYPWERDARAHRNGAPGRQPAHPAAPARTRRNWGWQLLGVLAIATVALRVFGVQLDLLDDRRAASGAESSALAIATPAGAASEPAAMTSAAEPALAVARPEVSTPAAWSVKSLRSRWTQNQNSLEVWGTTDASSGATVRITLSVNGRQARKLSVAPVADGRYYAKVHVPSAMQHKRLRIRARVTD